jgi:pseudouridine kinase
MAPPVVGQCGSKEVRMPHPIAPSLSDVPREALVVVVGGANTDVVGVPTGALRQRDSNPGVIRSSAGGVGRNVAENLARLGVKVELVTAFGGDGASASLVASCRGAGIGVAQSLTVGDLPGAHYLAILDERHDMAVAINDMRVLDRLTPEVLAEPDRTTLLLAADLVIADANLPADTLAWLAGAVRAPILFEPVSAAKTGRVAPVLDRLAAITPNTLEAAELLGHEVVGIDAARQAASELVARGVGVAFVTCGADGIAWADASGSGAVAAPRVEVANASGAGDAFCAGIAFALLAQADARAAALFGTAMAAFALTDDETVSRAVTRAAALEKMKELG